MTKARLHARDIRRNMINYNTDHEAVFSAEQNALVAVNAERYYHVMMRGGEASWNIRDRHMAQTLQRLSEILQSSLDQ